MKTIDVINQLAAEMPKYSDDFTESVNILSIVPNGTTATVTTDAAHGLIVGQNVVINGSPTPIQIDTIQRTGEFLRVTTLQDHDLTLSQRDKFNGGKTVELSGSNESEFNGVFNLLDVPNRRNFTVAIADAGAITGTGQGLLLDGGLNLFSGHHTVTSASGNTFTVELSQPYTVSATGGTVAISIRISGCLDIARYVRDIYTKKEIGDDTLVVQLGDVTRSKSRTETTDATDSTQGYQQNAPTFIHSFAVYIIQNSTQDLDGHKLRDKVETLHVPSVIRSLERVVFDTGFAYSEYGAVCTNHGVYLFEERDSQKSALYVHELVFDQLSILDSGKDMFCKDDSRAMRDVSLTVCTDKGKGLLTSSINLDEQAL